MIPITPHNQSVPRKPVSTADALYSLSAYYETVEIDCQDCMGSGRDPGARDHEIQVCPSCLGTRKETAVRNFLSEAFAIVQTADSQRNVERAHLVAIVRYARAHVSALIQLPEVA